MDADMSPEVRRLGPLGLVREQDVRAALTTLAAGPAGLVITGDAGTGKSALARQVLERLRTDGWGVAAMVGRWSPRTLFRGVTEAFLGWGKQLSPEQTRMMGAIGLAPSDDEMLDTTCRLLESFPLVLLFDDLSQNLDGAAFLDPGFAEVFDRLCRAAGRGRVLVTSRTPLPADNRLGVLRLGPLDLASGAVLAAGLPFLSTVDPATLDRVVRTTAGYPRSLRLIDDWLSANPGGAGARLAAVTPGAAPVDLVLADLTAPQRETLLQAAIATVPFTAYDLAVACDTSEPDRRPRPKPKRKALQSTQATADRLTEFGLLSAWEGWDGDTVYLVDRWIAEALAPHQGPAIADRHERAMNMHYSRTHEDGTFDDYVAVCRHLIAVQGIDDLTSFARAIAESLETDHEYAGMALLGEIAPHVPAAYHSLLREHLIAMLLRHGFPRAAREVAERSLPAVKEWAATHPQRDEARFCLGAAHDSCGQARFADGYLVEAEAVLTVAVDIYHELAAEHPTFMEADQRLAGSLQRLGEVYRALDLPEHKDKEYETWSECSMIRTRLFQALMSPEAALEAALAFQRLAGLAERDGDRDNARRLLGTRLTMVEAMAEMYPDEEEVTAKVAAARQEIAALDDPGRAERPGVAADGATAEVIGILRQGPHAFNQWRADHAEEELDLSGADLRGLNLDQMVFAGADLTGADLSRVSARGAIFSGADLTEADLAGADLTRAGFGFSEMVDAAIAFTRLGRAMIQPATLTGAVLAGARLDHTSFRECDLTGVDLRGCDLSTLDLKRSSLDGAITGSAVPASGDGGAAAEERHYEPELADPAAMMRAGMSAFECGRFSDARRWFERAAQAGEADALGALAMTFDARGDVERAELWYQRAADAGHGPVMHDYGVFLAENGHRERAEEMYRRAAAAGQAPSMCNLGLLCEERGDHEEAGRWFHRALDTGYTRAAFYLGRAAHARDDIDGAIGWARIAADGGDPEAMNTMARLLQSYADDPAEVQRWVTLAAQAGQPDAQEALRRLNERP
ncbi:pentapeptide repeat-containing protein [Nonomuraea angiospora]|uniref:pentapeptide repeat-containing protein n=1 Tax=Nonomuraea angiospora TaxID=46172 RepID=UPI00379C1FE7